jgi:hypothetical protein
MTGGRFEYYFTGPIQHDPFVDFILLPSILAFLLLLWWGFFEFRWPRL